jgi:hypothetical protein
MGYLARVRHPEWYHGHRRKPPFFEGWYYKLVSADGSQRYAIIPGIFKSDDRKENHSFVQVLNGITGVVVYHRFPADAFRAATGRFEVTVGASRFTQHDLSLQLNGPEQALYGEVRFEGVTPWPVTCWSPGIMGPFGWLPGDRPLAWECNHGVLSLDHALRGRFVVDGSPRAGGAVVDWTGGRGYIEKDWGAAFPSAWIWMQSNHFNSPQAQGSCLTASIATIPTPLGTWFRGMIVGLWHQGQLYRFATYTGARLEHLALDERAVTWVMRDRSYRLELRATRAEKGLLLGPSTQSMGVRVPETLSATVEVRLSRLRGGRNEIVLEDTGRYAGLEAVGDLDKLVKRQTTLPKKLNAEAQRRRGAES